MANFIERTLEPGEKVVFQGRLHWTYNFQWTFGGAVLAIGAGLMMALICYENYNSFNNNSLALVILCVVCILAGFGCIGWGYFIRSRTEFAITNTRFIQKDGIFDIKMTEIPLFKIETVNFYQTFLQRLLSTGEIELVGSGGTSHRVPYVQEPFKVRNLLTTLMKDSKEE